MTSGSLAFAGYRASRRLPKEASRRDAACDPRRRLVRRKETRRSRDRKSSDAGILRECCASRAAGDWNDPWRGKQREVGPVRPAFAGGRLEVPERLLRSCAEHRCAKSSCDCTGGRDRALVEAPNCRRAGKVSREVFAVGAFFPRWRGPIRSQRPARLLARRSACCPRRSSLPFGGSS